MRLRSLLAVILVTLIATSTLAAPPKRNFLFILADDLGNFDLSVAGSATTKARTSTALRGPACGFAKATQPARSAVPRGRAS